MKLSVQLVVWNGAKYIPYLFASLRKQTYRDWSLLVIDNNSTDDTVAAITRELANFPASYRVLENKENLGFAGGHNQVFKENDSEYVLLLNQDMYLEPDCLEKMVKFLDEHPEAAAVSPRLMKWDFSSICHPDESQDLKSFNLDDERSRIEFGMTNMIDALGLKIFRNRRVIEQYTQREWNSVKGSLPDGTVGARDDKGGCALEVFGLSGAFPMYRHSALKEILFSNGDFLDSLYHSYKEDVDLAYRLASRGWKSFVLLDSVAYHDRSGAGPKEMTDSAALVNKKTHSPWVKYNSYKNHLMTLYKNEYWPNLILDFPWILWYELKKFAYLLLFDRKVLAGLSEVWKLRRELAQKREWIKKLRKIDYKEIRKWWLEKKL